MPRKHFMTVGLIAACALVGAAYYIVFANDRAPVTKAPAPAATKASATPAAPAKK